MKFWLNFIFSHAEMALKLNLEVIRLKRVQTKHHFGVSSKLCMHNIGVGCKIKTVVIAIRNFSFPHTHQNIGKRARFFVEELASATGRPLSIIWLHLIEDNDGSPGSEIIFFNIWWI